MNHLSDLKKPPELKPIRFEACELPEVIEYHGRDGERLWALSTALDFAQTGAGEFDAMKTQPVRITTRGDFA